MLNILKTASECLTVRMTSCGLKIKILRNSYIQGSYSSKSFLYQEIMFYCEIVPFMLVRDNLYSLKTNYSVHITPGRIGKFCNFIGHPISKYCGLKNRFEIEKLFIPIYPLQ